MDLEAVTQDFVSDMTRYLAGMDAAIAKSVEFADSCKAAEDAVSAMALAADDAAVVIDAAMAMATGSVRDLAGEFAKARAATGVLRGGLDDVDTQAAATVAALTALDDELDRKAAAFAATGAATAALTSGLDDVDAKVAGTIATLVALDLELDKKKAAMAGLALGSIATAGAVGAAGGAAARAGAGFRLFGVGIRLTGTALHWIVAGTMEFLAVAGPAAVAASAWMFVWLQGATNVYQHMSALFGATEALGQASGQTYGEMLGLSGAFQRAQNAANPDVYQALGAALLVVKETSGGLAQTGLQVGRIFDAFMGKLVYDFSAAGGGASNLHDLLSAMIPDLVGFGQVFGNLGHFLASFAAQMPGLAEVLLHLLAGFLDLAKGIVDFTQHIGVAGFTILTVVMGMEEFARWGGLLVGLMGRMGFATVALEGNFASVGGFFTRFGSVALNLVRGTLMVFPAILSTVGSYMMRLGGQAGAAGLAMRNFGADMTDGIAAIGPGTAVAILGIATVMGILIDKAVTAKSAAQQFADSLQSAAEKASDMQVLAVIGQNLSILAARAAQAKAEVAGLSQSADQASRVFGRGGGGIAGAIGSASSALKTYNAATVQQVADAGNVVKGAEQIAQAYSLTIPQAIGLAAAANVSLTGVLKNSAGQWTALGEQVRSAYAGFAAMGQGAGLVGNDMLALAIQSGLAGTKMSQLNQAWDAFMQDLTGGTSALAGFNQALTNLSTGSNDVTNILGKAGSISLSIRNFAQSLTSFSGKGAQAWQNFNQVVGSTAPQLIDWLRTAGAAGVVTEGQFTKAVEGMITKLIPLAARSKTAQAEIMGLAQQAGLNVTSWAALKQQLNDSNASMADTTKVVSAATIALGNMASVAQNLGDVMSSQVTAAISNAALKSAGFYTDLAHLTQAMQTGSSAGHDAAYWAEQMGNAYSVAGDRAQTAAGKMAKGAATSAGSVKGMAATVEASVGAATRSVDALALAIAGIHGKTVYINTVDNQIQKHAAGTDSAQRGMALVGEKGPELVWMQGGEHVMPAHQTRTLMKMAGAVHGIHGYAAGTQSSTALMDQLTRELSVLAMRLMAASSVQGMQYYVHNLLSTIRQLASAGKIDKAADSEMVTLIGRDNKKLDHLFSERAKILARIKKADQYAASVSQAAQSSASLSTIMQGAGGAPVSSSYLLASMRIDLAGIRRFDSDIKKLERMGLDRQLLNQIIQMGPAQGDQVAQALINGPLSNIKALNATESQVQKASKNLGRTTADRMFDAGKDAGKGFLSGLEGEQHAIEALMEKIARDMVRTLKHELGIHSPSSVTREMGRNLMDGIPLGVADRMPSLDSSLRSAAGHVTSALSSAAGGSSGGGGDIVIHNHVLVPLPSSRQQYQEIQTQSLRVNRRNPDNRLALTRGRGGR